MPNNLASNSTAPDFSEASPGYGGAAALPSVDLYNQTQEFAARRRIKMGKGTWQDYARFASELPGQLVNNLASAAVSGATAPADALAGRLPMQDPETGHTSEEGMRRSLDLAGLSSSATLGAPAEAAGDVALGAGAMRKSTELPMDAASRAARAKEQGFTIDAYHGTRSPVDFDEFSTEGPPHEHDSGSGADPSAYMGAHFALEPEVANKFAEGKTSWLKSRYVQEGSTGARVIPVKLRGKYKQFKDDDEVQSYIYQQPSSHDAVTNELERLAGEDWDKLDELGKEYDKDPKFREDVNRDAMQSEMESAEDGGVSFAQDLGFNAKSKLKDEGYHGFKHQNTIEGGTGIAVFDPENIRSHAAAFDPAETASGNILFANKSKEAGALALASDTERAPPFYSAVERAVESSPTKAATASEWLGPRVERTYQAKDPKTGETKDVTEAKYSGILGNIPGVKTEELDALGLADKLKDRPGANQLRKWTKEEIQKVIAENKVKLGEVWKNQQHDYPYQGNEWQTAIDRAEAEGDWDEAAHIQAAWEGLDEEGTTVNSPKFADYQLPGSDNYKEMLVTLPGKDAADKARFDYLTAKESLTPAEEAEHEELNKRVNYRNKDSAPQYESPHWDEPNVLAHVRMNDRELPDASGTPQHTLFLEELQSDWHQTGRKEGYRTDQGVDLESRRKAEGILTRAQQAGAFIVPSRLLDQGISPTLADHMLKSGRITQEEANFLKDYKPRHTEEFARDGMVPDAPFKRSWPQLLLHRMVRHAAENGYDQIAWTDGATQAERYDLSKHVSKIQFVRNRDYAGHLQAMDHQGRVVIDKTIKNKEELPDLIGKEAADKLLANEHRNGNGIHTLEGVDLKVGGEGMKGFYDDMLPKIANKAFGKLGGKVKTQKLVGDKSKTELQQLQEQYDAAQTNDERWRINDEMRQLELLDANNDGLYKGEGKDHTIHVLPITPEMRRHALSKGFPLFSSGVPVPDGSSVEPYQRDKVVSGVKLTPVDHQPEF